jgi:hypothetical protein
MAPSTEAQMTGREIVSLLGREPAFLVAAFAALPVLAWIVGWIHGPGRGLVSPWRFVYSGLVYLACVPGVGAAVLTAYTLFFTHENLLDQNVLVYVLPVASMAVTLGIMSRRVSFKEIPGFDRLSGLMVLIAITFVLLLVVRRTWIGLFFGGSIATLLVLGAGLFALLKWGAYALFRRKDEPRTDPPPFPRP